LNILRIHWTYAIKDDSTRKARATMDGSKRAAPWLHEAVKTYASCVDQCSMVAQAFRVLSSLTA